MSTATDERIAPAEPPSVQPGGRDVRFEALVTALAQREEALLRANARLHSVITMQSEICATGFDRIGAMRCVTEQLVGLVGADLAAVATPVGVEFEYPVMVGRKAPDQPPRLHRSASLTGWCFEHGQSYRCDDIAADPRASNAATQALGVGSILLVPVLVKGAAVGVLTALSHKVRAFDEEDLGFVELVAGILGAALANIGAHEERHLLLAERTAALVRSTRSEELFRALAEHSDEIIFIADRDGMVRYVSPSITRLMGWPLEEIQGTSAFMWTHPEDQPRLARAIGDVMGQAGRSESDTIRVRHKNGSWRYLEFSGRNLSHIPAINGLSANARDVTARVEAAKAIEFQAKLLQSVEQAVLGTDLEGRITFWNGYAERLYGWTAAEAMGRGLADLTVVELNRAGQEAIIAVLASGQSWRGEVLLKRKDGSTFVGQVIDTPVFGPDGQITGYVGVSYDLTERRQLEDQLRQSQKLQAIGELAGGVAHDFNNVLTAITSYSELLLQDESDKAKRDDLLEIKGAARRAADLTKKLLAFSRRQVMQVQVIDVSDVVRAMEKMLSRLINENILLDTHYPVDELYVEADPTQLEQVVMNLVVNARDAMPRGGTIRVRVDREGDACVLRVSDNGVGMTEETRARMFEPFFTTKPAGKGTGLGLPVVYGIVHQFRGSIDVATAVGKGTEFVIRLPLSRDATAEPTAEHAASSSEKPGTIVLVEDNQVLSDLARRILSRNGYDVVTAPSAAAALALLDQGQAADLLIVDIVLPDMRGPELVARVAANGRHPRVLYMSGYTRESCVDCDAQLPVAFLSKPWTPHDLLTAVRELLAAPVSAAA